MFCLKYVLIAAVELTVGPGNTSASMISHLLAISLMRRNAATAWSMSTSPLSSQLGLMTGLSSVDAEVMVMLPRDCVASRTALMLRKLSVGPIFPRRDSNTVMGMFSSSMYSTSGQSEGKVSSQD